MKAQRFTIATPPIKLRGRLAPPTKVIKPPKGKGSYDRAAFKQGKV